MHALLSIIADLVPWPFPVRPSLENLSDPEVRAIVGGALLRLGLGVALVTLGFIRWRGRIAVPRFGRIAAVLALSVLAFVEAPNLSWLLVEAFPTTFRVSPTGFSAASIASGQAVFARNCVACHGEDGSGLGDPARDLRAHHVLDHPEGDLFWFVSHGIPAEPGGLSMPPFGETLTEPERWSAIDYVRALGAGAVSHGLTGWSHAVMAPGFPLRCLGLPARSLAGLRGGAVLLLMGPNPGPVRPLEPVNGIRVATIWLRGGAAAPTDAPAAQFMGVDCQSDDPAAKTAYTILARGGPGEGQVPVRFLIDPGGVLRSISRRGGDEDPASLLDEIRTVCTEPLTVVPGESNADRP